MNIQVQVPEGFGVDLMARVACGISRAREFDSSLNHTDAAAVARLLGFNASAERGRVVIRPYK